MKISIFILLLVSAAFDGQIVSEILETVTLEEGKAISGSLVNFTDLLIKKQRLPGVDGIKIYPISDSDLHPFQIKFGQLLQLNAPVDREAVCANIPSQALANICSPDMCCLLLGFQYRRDTNVHSFFVLVRILDINDQAPRFQSIKQPYNTIPENVEERFEIELPVAVDLDSAVFGVQRYTILQLFPSDKMTDFQFVRGEETPPRPRLFVSATLDYEKTRKYKFKLYAYDTPAGRIGNNCSIEIEIEIEDINDNTPKFEISVYNVEIKENELPDHILKWKVVDADSGENGKVKVFIDSEEMARKFQITMTKLNEGLLRLIVPLDYENELDTFQFNLMTKDCGQPSRSSKAIVKVRLHNVNDNAPRIRFKMLGQSASSTVSLVEGITSHSLVVEVRVTDIDSISSAIMCWLLDFRDLFYLDQPVQHNSFLNFKLYNLRTMGVIDRESVVGPLIRVTVNCNDGDNYITLSTNESLNIRIEDVNDNAPQFSKQSFVGSVEENLVNGNVLFKEPIIVTDKDSELNGRFEFFIEDFFNSTDSVVFLCDKRSGIIVTQSQLDFEIQSQYRFKMISKDQGNESLSSTATILVTVVDLNDNPPIFTESHYTFSIAEDVLVGTKIGSVLATDIDTDPKCKAIRYDLRPMIGNVDSFKVDRNTGEIRIRKPLDREKQESITFGVMASNYDSLVNLEMRVVYSEVSVIVKVTDVNDNPPQFKAKPNLESKIEFVIEQYVEGNTCAELPFTVEDADSDGNAGSLCCTVSLESDYDHLFSIMTNNPTYICLRRRPHMYQSLTITLVARDSPSHSQKSLSSKVSFPVIIKNDPSARPSANILTDTVDSVDRNPSNSRNIIIITILTTVFLVFIGIVIIVIVIFRQCSFVDEEFIDRKCYNTGTKGVLENNDYLKPDDTTIQSCQSQPQMILSQRHISPQTYSGNLQEQFLRHDSKSNSLFVPYIHYDIITNQDMRILTNPHSAADQYIQPCEQQMSMTDSRSILSSSSDKVQQIPQTIKYSTVVPCQSKTINNNPQDSAYQILNPFCTLSSPQRQDTFYKNATHQSMSLLNKFFVDGLGENDGKLAPMIRKRDYFQSTFV